MSLSSPRGETNRDKGTSVKESWGRGEGPQPHPSGTSLVTGKKKKGWGGGGGLPKIPRYGGAL